MTRFLLTALHSLLATFPAMGSAAPLVSDIKSDEVVVFYPGYARMVPGKDTWVFSVRGSIFEPERGSLKRALLVRILRDNLHRELSAGEADIFNRRIRSLLVDHERGKRIWIRFANDSQAYAAGTSAASGYFEKRLELSAREVDKLLRLRQAPKRCLSFTAVTRPDDKREFSGRVALIGSTGLSVVSDIDDTIKISAVRNRGELLANTFLRPFRPVPGMARLFRTLADSGTSFHYVSASPWLLLPLLSEFRVEAGFPEGSFHLKQVRLTDATILNLFGEQEEYKRSAIEPILTDFPDRRFVLIGDSGEQDPKIFGRLAREHPGQVVAIFIRNVTNETAESLRFQQAFAGLPPTLWRLFGDPEDLRESLNGLLRRHGK
jgi:hypothetical protein